MHEVYGTQVWIFPFMKSPAVEGIDFKILYSEMCVNLLSMSTYGVSQMSLLSKKFMCIQIQSFEAELPVPELASKEGGSETFPGVFIRAPAILEVGPEVQVLADYPVPFNVLDSNSSIESPEVCYKLIAVMIYCFSTLTEKFNLLHNIQTVEYFICLLQNMVDHVTI